MNINLDINIDKVTSLLAAHNSVMIASDLVDLVNEYFESIGVLYNINIYTETDQFVS